MISVVEYLDGSKNDINIDDLEILLKDKYDEEDKEGLSYYEFFDMKTKEFKPHFDIEKLIEYNDRGKFDESQFLTPIYKVLNDLFDTDTFDWAMSEDNRKYRLKNDNKVYFKISYHLTLWNKKTNYETIKEYSVYINKKLKLHDIKIDTSIYRNGLTKFRMPYCKKDYDKWSVLKPKTYPNDFKKHIVQLIDGCLDYLQIKKEKIEIMKMNILLSMTKKDVMNQYKMIGDKKPFGNGFVYNVETNTCPFLKEKHNRNHNFIIENEYGVYLKCHSDKCKGRTICLYNENSKDNDRAFRVETFRDIKVANGKSDYNVKRKYFEKFFLPLCSSNSILKIDYKCKYFKNSNKSYIDKSIVIIKDLKGYAHLKTNLMLKNKKGEDELVRTSFVKTYLEDEFRNSYQDTTFDPSYDINNLYNDRYYNLFNGFGYEKILNNNDEITTQDLSNFETYLSYLKEALCNKDDKTYDFLIQHLASIVQTPRDKNHIILVFYSKKGGTGKSMNIKFFCEVMGMNYSYFGTMKQITERFTTAQNGKLINVIEEIDTKNFDEHYRELKKKSQEDTTTTEGKYQPEKSTEAFVRFMLALNDIFKISDDRRIVYFDCRKIKGLDTNNIEKLVKDKKIIYLFGEYLMNTKLKYNSISKWEKNRPITPATKLFSRKDSVEEFFINLYLCEEEYFTEYILQTIKDTLKEDTFLIKRLKLFGFYERFCEKFSIRSRKKNSFYSEIETIHHFITTKRVKGFDCYEINLQDINKKFKIQEEFKNNISRYNEDSSDEDSDEDSDEEN